MLNILGMRDVRSDVVTIRAIGGPTALIELGDLRLLTDPTFDPPGDYPIGDRSLTKTSGPAVDSAAIGEVDVVLLSHDQHPDNLDRRGRAYLASAPFVLSTAAARQRLGGAVRALANWEQVTVQGQGGRALRITGVPAQHGPVGSETMVGEVTGFMLGGDGLPTVYVSGDNASLTVVRTIVDRLGQVDGALLCAGAARTALMDHANLTLDSAQAAEAARILGVRWVVPLHYEGWAHFTQGGDTLRHAFAKVGLSEQLHVLNAGEQVALR